MEVDGNVIEKQFRLGRVNNSAYMVRPYVADPTDPIAHVVMDVNVDL